MNYSVFLFCFNNSCYYLNTFRIALPAARPVTRRPWHRKSKKDQSALCRGKISSWLSAGFPV